MANSPWGIDMLYGIDIHTDSSVMTILNQYEVGGLEVLKDNEWLQVKPIPDTLIVNLGDMMQVRLN
jgi:isopenicillin N synthase-like dioxygenase